MKIKDISNSFFDDLDFEYIQCLREKLYRDPSFINESDYMEQKCAIMIDAYNIENISDPSFELRLLAIQKNYMCLEYISNRSEEEEMEAVKHIKYYDLEDDAFVNVCIKSKRAKELYEKLKRMRNIIK
jgi:hypothetical protein